MRLFVDPKAVMKVIGTTGASSLRRTVSYVDEFGPHVHWQQIKVEFVEGAK